jgi:hypothetical protein
MLNTTRTRRKSPSPAKRAKRPRGRKQLPIEQRFPETSLPFVRYVGPSRHWLRQCDCWAPQRDDNCLEQSFAGRRYAQLTVRFMRKHRESGSPLPACGLLLDIIDSMIRKRRFWGTKPGAGDTDFVAIGFIAALGDILVMADQMGLVNADAMAHAAHLESALKASKGIPRGARKVTQEAAAAERRFAESAR